MSIISVVIPVYNVENYVSKCIESVIKQTYKDLEIIIVNDGSTDRSGSICDFYSRLDKRIVIIHQENKGLSAARNKGIESATGEYIGFVDSDDWIQEDMYEFLYKNIINYNADISICGCRHVYSVDHNIDDASTVKKDDIKTIEGKDIISNYIINYKKGLIKNIVWDKLYKRNLFDKILFPEGKIYEDHFVSYKLLDKARKVVISNNPKYNYFIRGDSLSHRPPSKHIFDLFDAHVERYEFVKAKYCSLEREYRRILLCEVINILYLISKFKLYDMVIDRIYEMRGMVNSINIYNCGMTPEQMKLLELFMNGTKAWIISMRLYELRERR